MWRLCHPIIIYYVTDTLVLRRSITTFRALDESTSAPSSFSERKTWTRRSSLPSQSSRRISERWGITIRCWCCPIIASFPAWVKCLSRAVRNDAIPTWIMYPPRLESFSVSEEHLVPLAVLFFWTRPICCKFNANPGSTVLTEHSGKSFLLARMFWRGGKSRQIMWEPTRYGII